MIRLFLARRLLEILVLSIQGKGGRTKRGRVSVGQTRRDLTRIGGPWSTFDPVCNSQQTPTELRKYNR